MWSRNTVRESSHISFFCTVEPFCEVLWRPENTHGEAHRFAWVTSRSLPLLERRTDLPLSPERPAGLFKSSARIWTRLFAHAFSVYGLLSELTYFRFFPVICWSYPRTEISVSLSIANKTYSLPFSFIFCDPLCWCYLATALNMLSSYTSPAELVYYSISIFVGYYMPEPFL